MDILQLISDTDRRGAQVFATELGLALEQRGHGVRTVALAPGPSSAPLEVQVLAESRWSLRGQLNLRHLAGAADVVVAHGSDTAAASSVTLGRTRTPIVYRQISDSQAWAATALRRARVRLYLSQMHHVVALWSGSAQALERGFGVDRARLTVIPNGVRAHRYLAITRPGPVHERPRFAYLGAMAPGKGIDDLRWLAGERPDIDIVAAGDGPLLAELRAQAPPNLSLPGPTDDAAAFLAEADAFVLASHSESMPGAVIEAALAGLPVVVTDVGACSEMVPDGIGGLVVVPGDRAALLTAVARLAADPSDRLAMGLAARAHARRYDMGTIAERWEAVLRAVTRARRP